MTDINAENGIVTDFDPTDLTGFVPTDPDQAEQVAAAPEAVKEAPQPGDPDPETQQGQGEEDHPQKAAAPGEEGGVTDGDTDILEMLVDQVTSLTDSIDRLLKSLETAPGSDDVSLGVVAIKVAVAAGVQQAVSEILTAMANEPAQEQGNGPDKAGTGALDRNRTKILEYMSHRYGSQN